MAKKKFTEGLESILGPASDEAVPGDNLLLFPMEEEKGSLSKKSPARKKRRKPIGGLDLLIRKTLDQESLKEEGLPTKRVTITFERAKLEKLKTISRMQKVYLKDIINDLVDNYIDHYEEENGDLKN